MRGFKICVLILFFGVGFFLLQEITGGSLSRNL